MEDNIFKNLMNFKNYEKSNYDDSLSTSPTKLDLIPK